MSARPTTSALTSTVLEAFMEEGFEDVRAKFATCHERKQRKLEARRALDEAAFASPEAARRAKRRARAQAASLPPAPPRALPPLEDRADDAAAPPSLVAPRRAAPPPRSEDYAPLASARRAADYSFVQDLLHRVTGVTGQFPDGRNVRSAHQEERDAASLVADERAHDEGYGGDKSDADSSGDEAANEVRASMRSILPKLANVAMPTPRPSAFDVDELVAKGGTPIAEVPNDDWL